MLHLLRLVDERSTFSCVLLMVCELEQSKVENVYCHVCCTIRNGHPAGGVALATIEMSSRYFAAQPSLQWLQCHRWICPSQVAVMPTAAQPHVTAKTSKKAPKPTGESGKIWDIACHQPLVTAVIKATALAQISQLRCRIW